MKRMMNFLFAANLLAAAAGAQAIEAVTPPGILSDKAARSLLDQDPGVAAARAGLEVALQEAGILNQSAYEWTARASGQHRRIDAGQRYGEWNIGIERTIRLPGKAAADRKIGRAVVDESKARYGEALHEAARELAALWVDWLAAERAHELAGIGLASAQSSLAAVEKRFQAGDASKLDTGMARAELAEHRRLENDARTQAAASWSRLSKRFPGITRESVSLPNPLPIAEDALFWQERILAESDQLKVVQMQLQKAQAQLERARENRTPDPTVGVYAASEANGRERISGVTLSIPIAGGVRHAQSAQAVAAAEVKRQELEFKKRQLEAEVASAVVTARGAYDSLQIAKEGAASMQENAALMQRAYELGEAQLQELLLAKRQAASAANNTLQAQAAALKAYYALLIDAHLVWDLQND